MDFHAMSDLAVLQEMGKRVRILRLRRNVTQESLAESTLLSVGTIKALESGNSKLSTLVNVLRELNAMHELDSFIPEITISPLEIAKQKSPQRIRAGRRSKDASNNTNPNSTELDW